MKTLSVAIVYAALLSGCDRLYQAKIEFDTEYQAILLDNGQAYFGKISDMRSDFLLVGDVFYVKTETNPETKTIRNLLVKRGGEWHMPTNMRLNKRHILAIEPVASDSKVGQLIRDAKNQQRDSALENK